MAAHGRPASPVILRLIRIQLLVGALTLGAVAWYLHRDPAWQPSPSAGSIRFVAVIAGVAAAVGVLAVRAAIRRGSDPSRIATLSIVGWALGELAALAGGVHFFASGEPSRYVIGLLLLLTSLLLLPMPGGHARGW